MSGEMARSGGAAMGAGADRPIRVLLVDDQRLMRDGLRALLELQDGLEVVGEAASGAEAVALAAALRPDVALMDVRMPGMDGVEATRALAACAPGTRVLVLTTFDDDEYVFAALEAGAAGYVLKDIPAAELAAAIRTVHAGGTHLGPTVAAKLVSELSRLHGAPAPATPAPPGPPSPASGRPRPVDELTPREREVLQLLGRGATNAEIAARLVISEGTAKNHVSNILGRLGLRDRTQAALYAREHGLA
jgi:DNA-binding NarL/FixJ family response regulator